MLCDCPGYAIDNDRLAEMYTAELRAAYEQNTLQGHVDRWKVVFELGAQTKPDSTRQMETDLITGNVDWAQIRKCLDKLLSKDMCEHPNGCHAQCLAIPFALLCATLLAKQYGVPICTALHQAFCDDPEHKGCFG